MTASSEGPAPPEIGRGEHGYTLSFDKILAIERDSIKTRRGTASADRPFTGLALSGGGIRSASFCLGVVQALDASKAIPGIDYLSTVSGGGYTGCCLTACMSQSKGGVPFNEAKGYGDTEAVRHLRDFSNYLIPRGARDILVALGLIARGLAANIMLAGLFFVLSVLIFLLCRPDQQSLKGNGLLDPLVKWATGNSIPLIRDFPATTVILATMGVWLVLWVFAKSLATSDVFSGCSEIDPNQTAEFQGFFVWIWRALFCIVALSAWLELQPLVASAILDPPSLIDDCYKGGNLKDCVAATVSAWFSKIAPSAAPLAAVVTLYFRQIGRATSARKNTQAKSTAQRALAKTLLWAAALILPSFLWWLYLKAAIALMPAGLTTYLKLLVGFAALLLAACLINPNATSLHRFYRDRLSKAFLFDPDPNHRDERGDKDLKAVALKLHEIATEACCFPVINAALNLEGSAFANRRGRNADFFEFTPYFTGCEATGWVGSKHMAEEEPKLDLGTAMAISGAAFSPNMGSATIKPLVPTLALLNLRLGFWLRNPLYVMEKRGFFRKLIDIRSLLLLKEVFSHIDERDKTVYVTDGGNIENLGIYALLKRKCELIIAVDAEADPTMSFGSLIKLQRYARIDLGVLIDVPWEAIRDRTLKVDGDIEGGRLDIAGHGPHIAVGTIRYGESKTGRLVYIKASLTGDESDYILDYKRRNTDFPHETTGDQFFGEEQLEVYRALGFHIARYLLDGRSEFAIDPKEKGTDEPAARKRIETEILSGLGIKSADRDLTSSAASADTRSSGTPRR